jgi:site-specific recombinase XerD
MSARPRSLPPPLTLDAARDSYLRALAAEGRSVHTLKSYAVAINQLMPHCTEAGRPLTVDSIRAAHVRAFLTSLLTDHEPSSVETRYNSLKGFFAWLVVEGEIADSPMNHMRRPQVPQKDVEVLTEDSIRALLRGCDSRTFLGRRDAAIIRFLADSGVRVGGLLSMTTEGVDLKERLARVRLKGGRWHLQPFGTKVAHDLDRYLRSRMSHQDAGRPELWLGLHGPLTDSGVRQMLATRAAQAQITDRVFPHRFRHTFADRWLSDADGKESDLIALVGWAGGRQLERYGRARRAARAREAHRRMSPGDRL